MTICAPYCAVKRAPTRCVGRVPRFGLRFGDPLEYHFQSEPRRLQRSFDFNWTHRVAHGLKRWGINPCRVEVPLRIFAFDLSSEETAPQHTRIMVGPELARGAIAIPIDNNSNKLRN